jgi:hypothetical protein
MGYRSEVIFAVTPAAAPAFMALLAKYPEVKDMCHEADEFYSGYQEEGDWFMMWSGIKWYDGYPNVDTIESFIDALESDDLSEYGEEKPPVRSKKLMEDGKEKIIYEYWEEHFKFVRLGEDDGDNVHRGHAYDDIYISRSLSY